MFIGDANVVAAAAVGIQVDVPTGDGDCRRKNETRDEKEVQPSHLFWIRHQEQKKQLIARLAWPCYCNNNFYHLNQPVRVIRSLWFSS